MYGKSFNFVPFSLFLSLPGNYFFRFMNEWFKAEKTLPCRDLFQISKSLVTTTTLNVLNIKINASGLNIQWNSAASFLLSESVNLVIFDWWQEIDQTNKMDQMNKRDVEILSFFHSGSKIFFSGHSCLMSWCVQLDIGTNKQKCVEILVGSMDGWKSVTRPFTHTHTENVFFDLMISSIHPSFISTIYFHVLFSTGRRFNVFLFGTSWPTNNKEYSVWPHYSIFILLKKWMHRLSSLFVLSVLYSV